MASKRPSAQVTIHCPKCYADYKVDRAHLGKKTRCPACGEAFTAAELFKVEEVASPPLPFEDPTDEPAPRKSPRRLRKVKAEVVEDETELTQRKSSFGKLRPCKHCSAPVAHNAKRCPNCGGKSPYPIYPEDVFGCFGVGCGFFMVAVVIAALSQALGFGCGGQSKSSSSERDYNAPPVYNLSASDIQVREVRVEPWTNPNGIVCLMVYVDWKNNSGRQARTVKATLRGYDAFGNLVEIFPDHTIYADSKGISPGDTYREPDGRGFILPKSTAAVRATATITKASDQD